MGEWLVGSTADFDEGDRRIMKVDGREIAVLKNDGRFHAISNYCLHMGGPVGEGMIMGKVEAVLTDDEQYVGERFSTEEIHIICPWHGWEYNIATGEFAGDRTRCLPTFEVVTRDGQVYVRT